MGTDIEPQNSGENWSRENCGVACGKKRGGEGEKEFQAFADRGAELGGKTGHTTIVVAPVGRKGARKGVRH